MKDSFYFTHDFNARTDPKIKRLLVRYNMIGYGIFWSIIEDLYNNTNVLPTEYDSIAYDLHVDTDVVKSVVEDFGLFEIKDGFFHSKSVQRRLDDRKCKSQKAKDSIKKRWEKRQTGTNEHENDTNVIDNNTNVLPTNNDSSTNEQENDTIKGKERKRKEKKGKEKKDTSNTPNVVLDVGEQEKREEKNITPPVSKAEIPKVFQTQILNLGECAQECAKDRAWMEAICMNYGLTESHFGMYMQKFEVHLKLGGAATKTIADFKSHFNNWLRQEKANGKDKLPNDSSKMRSGVAQRIAQKLADSN